MTRPRHPRVSIEDIVESAAEAFGVYVGDIYSHSRLAEYVRPRHAVYSIAYEAGYSKPEIGRRIARRDNATVLSGIRRVVGLRAADADFAAAYDEARRVVCQ